MGIRWSSQELTTIYATRNTNNNSNSNKGNKVERTKRLFNPNNHNNKEDKQNNIWNRISEEKKDIEGSFEIANRSCHFFLLHDSFFFLSKSNIKHFGFVHLISLSNFELSNIIVTRICLNNHTHTHNEPPYKPLLDLIWFDLWLWGRRST